MDKQRTKVVYPFVKRRPREETQQAVITERIYVYGSSAAGISTPFLTREMIPRMTDGPISFPFIQVRNVVTASIMAEAIITTGSAVRVV